MVFVYKKTATAKSRTCSICLLIRTLFDISLFREVSQKKLNYIMSLNKSEDALDADLLESMDEEVGEANIKRRTVVGPWKNL